MRNNGRTRAGGKLLPIHPQPEKGELLSSWVTRIARRNLVKLHTFSQHALNGESIWSRDIDKSAGYSLVRTLAGLTGKGEERIWQTTIRGTCEGRLYTGHTAKGSQRWVTPLGVYHRKRKRHGLLYCPFCLREGDTPYFRVKWRLALASVCARHEVRLHDRCHSCGGTVAFHRSDFLDKHNPSTLPITVCAKCGEDLRRAYGEPVERSLLLRFQRKLFETMKRGYVHLPEYGKVHSHLWFDALYQLAKIIGLARRGEKLRSRLEALTGTEEPPDGARPPGKGGGRGAGIESVPLKWRRHVLYLLGWMLEDWPERFFEVARDGALTYSIARVSAIGKLPFWYDDFCKRYLKTPTYSPTETEILEAYRWLKSRGQRHSIHATSMVFGIRGGSKKVRRVLKETGNA